MFWEYVALALAFLFSVSPGFQSFLVEFIGGIGSSFIDQIPAGAL